MNDALERVIRNRIERSLESLSVDPHDDPREAEREIRLRFIEYHADFKNFGVESSGDLHHLRVRVRRRATAQVMTVDVQVDVRGTPLEARRGLPS